MYNNPYNFYPYMNPVGGAAFGGSAVNGNIIRGATRPSLASAFSRIKWGSILNNTQKTLNVINQAIPVYYQVKPIAQNLRSFGKIMSAFNSKDTSSNKTSTNVEPKSEPKKEAETNLPTFFIN